MVEFLSIYILIMSLLFIIRELYNLYDSYEKQVKFTMKKINLIILWFTLTYVINYVINLFI